MGEWTADVVLVANRVWMTAARVLVVGQDGSPKSLQAHIAQITEISIRQCWCTTTTWSRAAEPARACYFKGVRAAISGFIAAILFTLGSGVLLLNCPFLLSGKSHSPCCPREEPTKCPLSKSFDTCPYVATESKIGPTENKLVSIAPVSAVSIAVLVASTATDDLPATWTPSQTGLHVRIRVFRI